MPRKFWWPGTLAEQLVLMTNFSAKIGGYETVLPITKQQITDVKALCAAFIAAVNGVDQCRQTMQAMTNWRDNVLYGEPEGTPAPAAPVFTSVTLTDATLGIVPQFISFRDLIVASPGYTVAIGEDLGLVGPEVKEKDATETSPAIKSVSSSGVTVTVTGSMKGFDAMRIEYAPKGGSWQQAAFLTNTPGSFQITPAKADQPETGHIRAIYIKKNEDFGNYSADYPVTLV